MEWKPTLQGTYGPNMNAFWWVVCEIFPTWETCTQNFCRKFHVRDTNERTNIWTDERTKMERRKLYTPRHKCRGYKYLQWDSIKCQFPFFHYKSMAAAKATRVLIRLEQKTKLFIPPAYRCYMWNLVRIGFMASEEMSFENADGRRTMDACLYYNLTYEPSAQVS